ncbi:MAG: glycerophosphodiester phosphodiesterase family protein [Clostridia bacterium]|nr:glycerophosphodiester phosphodiesterase family protein [Clostridia bacterium]
MKKTKKILISVFTLVFCFVFLLSFVSAKDNQSERIGNFNNPKGRVFSAAKRGDARYFPENSAEGIRFCAEKGIDIVQIDLQKTKDDKYILMKDTNLERMTLHRDGSSSKVNIKDETLENIKQNYLLKEGHGGPLAKPTKLQIATFEEAIDIAKNRCMLLVDIDFNDAFAVNNIVKNKGATDFVILRGAKNADEVSKFTKSAGLPACPVSSVYTQSTKGSAKKFSDASITAGANCVTVLSSKKSPFKQKTTDILKDKGRAIVDMSSPELCGGLEDNEKGWQEMMSAGFGIIESDYPIELAQYLEQTTAKRGSLLALINNVEGLNINAYSNDSAKKLQNALSEAKEKTQVLKTPLNELKKASYDLQEAVYHLEIRTEQDDKENRNKIITIVVFVIIAVVTLGGYFLFRKKNPKAQASNKKKKTNNRQTK